MQSSGEIVESLSRQDLSQVNIGGNVCYTPGSCVYAHELGHVIGLQHEHQRADRNRYVSVNPASSTCTDYDVLKQCTFTENGSSDIGEYDLAAVTAYGSSGSSTNPPSPTGTALLTAGGQCYATAGVVQGLDVYKVNELYSRQYGNWKRFRSLGTDNGSTSPLGSNISSGVNIKTGTSPATNRRGSVLESFVVGSDNAVWFRSKDDAAPTWPAWTSLGGGVLSSPAASTLNGATYVCAQGSDNALWCNWAVCSGGTFCGWGTLGKPSATVSVASAPAVVGWGSDKIDVFVRGSDNALWTRRYTSGWWGWSSLGGQIVGSPAAASRQAGVIDVVANTSAQWIYRLPFSSNTWGTWTAVSCCLASGSSPAIAANANRLDVVFHGSDNALWWMWWTPSSWNGPLTIGGRMVTDPAAVSAAGSTRVDVFKIGVDGALWYRWLN